MIIVVIPSEDPEEIAEERSAEAFSRFSAAIHSRVPDDHSVDLHAFVRLTSRAFCGDCGRVQPTSQNLCPKCAGRVISAEEVRRYRVLARRAEVLGLYDPAAAEERRVATLGRRGAIHIAA